jgi:hypothetical protein
MSQRMNYNAVTPAGMKALGAVYGYVRQSEIRSRLLDLVFLHERLQPDGDQLPCDPMALAA